MPKKIYCLYSNENETEFLAMARSVIERKEVTKEYTSGQWFSYSIDEDDSNVFYEDTKRKVNCKFPKIAIERDLKGNIIEPKEKNDDEKWIKDGKDPRVS